MTTSSSSQPSFLMSDSVLELLFLASQRITSISVACVFPLFAITTLIGIVSSTPAEVSCATTSLISKFGALSLRVTINSLVSRASPSHAGESSWSPSSSMLPDSETTFKPRSVVIRGEFGAIVTIATISIVSYASILGSWYLPSGNTTQMSSGRSVSSASTAVHGCS